MHLFKKTISSFSHLHFTLKRIDWFVADRKCAGRFGIPKIFEPLRGALRVQAPNRQGRNAEGIKGIRIQGVSASRRGPG